MSAAKKPVDPDAEERRDQRIGNWIVILAYGGGLLIPRGADRARQLAMIKGHLELQLARATARR
jgi:hypothetical protein